MRTPYSLHPSRDVNCRMQSISWWNFHRSLYLVRRFISSSSSSYCCCSCCYNCKPYSHIICNCSIVFTQFYNPLRFPLLILFLSFRADFMPTDLCPLFFQVDIYSSICIVAVAVTVVILLKDFNYKNMFFIQSKTNMERERARETQTL